MDNSVEQIGDAWIDYARYPSPAEAPYEAVMGYDDLFYLVDSGPAEKAWEVIKYITYRFEAGDLLGSKGTEASWIVRLLGAGPIEDLLSLHGPQFIDRVEAEAARDPRMAWALGGAWQFQMSDEIWARVQAAAMKWEE